MSRHYHPVRLADGSLNPRRRKTRSPRSRSGPSGKVSKFARGKFVAWDGEGWDVGASHRHIYTMLCNSVSEPLIDANGLSTLDCLNELCRIGAEHTDAVHVVFGGSYDVNMILSDCSREELARIHKGEWVVLGRRYVVCYRHRKCFTVKRWPTSRRVGGARVKMQTDGIVLWDVHGFFQSSFVSACEKYLGKNHPSLVEIRRQKMRRQVFNVGEVDDILHYCQLECELLAQLMRQLRDYLDTAGLKIRRWDGAGACAAALLQREGALEHRGVVPIEVMRASQRAYSGGRSEVALYGNVEAPIYHYDINSAYPSHMQHLPSLANGEWQHIEGVQAATWHEPVDTFALYHIVWSFGECQLYPFPWRSYDGSIFYPREGEGIFWAPEVNACMEAMQSGVLKGKCRIKAVWRWVDRANVKPFTWIGELYAQRAEWKRQGIGAEKVLKLAINSLYGKTAQHLGGDAENMPRYHRLEWAGYITSATRAQLYRAATPALKRRSIIMTATDALYSLEPLDLPCGDKLGEWEAHVHDGITVVQSGVYWIKDGDEYASYCRGFDKGSLDRLRILEHWRQRQTEYTASLTRFVGMGSALAQRTTENWRQWRKTDRKLALTTDGTKRYDATDSARWSKRNNPSQKLMRTCASIPSAWVAGQRMSAPFPLAWIDGGSRRTEWEPHIDGVLLSIAEQEFNDSVI